MKVFYTLPPMKFKQTHTMKPNKNILLLALQNLREQVQCTETAFFDNKLKEIDEQIQIVKETL